MAISYSWKNRQSMHWWISLKCMQINNFNEIMVIWGAKIEPKILKISQFLLYWVRSLLNSNKKSKIMVFGKGFYLMPTVCSGAGEVWTYQEFRKTWWYQISLLLRHFMRNNIRLLQATSNICKLYQTVVEQRSMNIQRIQKNMAVSDQLLLTHFMGIT